MPYTSALESSKILAPFCDGESNVSRGRKLGTREGGPILCAALAQLFDLLRRTEPEKPDKLSILAYVMERRTNTSDACERKRQLAAPRSTYRFIRRMLTENPVARTEPMSRFNAKSGSNCLGANLRSTFRSSSTFRSIERQVRHLSDRHQSLMSWPSSNLRPHLLASISCGIFAMHFHTESISNKLQRSN